MKAGFARVAGELGPPGASERAAAFVLSAIRPLRLTSDVFLVAQ
jgi:hypothetical protein